MVVRPVVDLRNAAGASVEKAAGPLEVRCEGGEWVTAGGAVVKPGDKSGLDHAAFADCDEAEEADDSQWW